MAEVRRSYCGLCHPRCGTLLHMEGGRVVKIKGDPDHPITRGVICERARFMVDHVYHPDRVNHPMKRIGKRGEGKWTAISWDQALDEVAERLDALRNRYGAETLSFTHGTHRTYEWDGRRFFNLFGSPNVCGVNNICMCPSYATEYATYGGMTWSDLRNAKCVVMWGKAPSESSPVLCYPVVRRLRTEGGTLIVVDPRRTKEAEIADLWLQIRPGTDVVLMLGWIKTIIDEGLYDREFVSRWTIGFDDVRAAASEYHAERVAEITWVPAELVKESARLYATVKPAVIPFGYGLDKQGVNATQCARARAILRAITGNLEVKGGETFSTADPVSRIIDEGELEFNEALPAVQRAKQLGADQYRVFGFPGWERNLAANKKLPGSYVGAPLADRSCLAHAREVFNAAITGQPYRISAVITVANNPLLAFPNTQRVYQALQALELYVVLDYYLTPSAALADYVLPAASTIERPELWMAYDFCMACPQGIEPLHERHNSYDFYRGLGIRLGQEEHWSWKTVEDVFDHCLSPVAMTFQDLVKQYGIIGHREYRRYEKYGFGTPSGKVELRSRTFEELGYSPVPTYREPLWSPVANPDLAKEYPLILSTGSRFMPMYHSEQRQIRKAREEIPDPLVTLHPSTAQEFGLRGGDWVRVASPHGKIRMRLRISDSVDPRMADVQHGWWFPERDQAVPVLFGVFESNANMLCPDDHEFCSPEIGSWPHSALLCRIEKEE